MLAKPELECLYRRLARPLERIVRAAVAAPDDVVEDACQFAWAQLADQLEQAPPSGPLAWLVTTAVREVQWQTRCRQRELSLETELELRGDSLADPRPGALELLACRERVGKLACLPARQRRFLFLRAFGYSYLEMAASERCTGRTIERELVRARAQLRAQAPEWA